MWNTVKNNLTILQLQNYISLTKYKNDILNNKLNTFNTIDTLNNSIKDNDNKESCNDSEILSFDVSYYFRKPWEKLATPHKIVKIKEYVKSLNYDKKNEDKIIDNLINKLKSKKLNKTIVNYNNDIGKIISIKNLLRKN